jgi:hypothetical protein
LSALGAIKLGFSALVDYVYQQASKNASKTSFPQDFPQSSHQIPQN